MCCTARDTTNEKTSRPSTLLYYLRQKERVGEISPKVIWNGRTIHMEPMEEI